MRAESLLLSDAEMPMPICNAAVIAHATMYVDLDLSLKYQAQTSLLHTIFSTKEPIISYALELLGKSLQICFGLLWLCT